MQGEIVDGGYPPPVDRLLTLGDPTLLDHPSRESRGWPDYRPSPLTGPLGPLLAGAGQDKADKAKQKAAGKSHKQKGKRK